MGKLIGIGEFNVRGTKLICTDPCYNFASDGTYIVNGVKPGVWNGFILTKVSSEVEIVEKLIAVHSSTPLNLIDFKQVCTNLNVDSGQMAICDLLDYSLDDDEYDKYCHVTLDNLAGLVGQYNSIKPYYTGDFSLHRAYAIVSRTGWGDGTYPLYIKQDNENVIGVMIEF